MLKQHSINSSKVYCKCRRMYKKYVGRIVLIVAKCIVNFTKEVYLIKYGKY